VSRGSVPALPCSRPCSFRNLPSTPIEIDGASEPLALNGTPEAEIKQERLTKGLAANSLKHT
jgi:hypothetical protein